MQWRAVVKLRLCRLLSAERQPDSQDWLCCLHWSSLLRLCPGHVRTISSEGRETKYIRSARPSSPTLCNGHSIRNLAGGTVLCYHITILKLPYSQYFQYRLTSLITKIIVFTQIKIKTRKSKYKKGIRLQCYGNLKLKKSLN
jgi:hypothetical protein